MNSIRKRRQLIIIKWSVFSLLLLLCAVLQTTPFLFQVGQVKPIYIVPLCVAVAMHEGEFSSAIFGAFCGLMWDYTAGRIAGLFALFMMLFCFFLSLIVQMYLRSTLLNYIWSCFAVSVMILSIDFMFFYWMPGFINPFSRYINFVLLTALVSLIVAAPIFYAVRHTFTVIKLKVEE